MLKLILSALASLPGVTIVYGNPREHVREDGTPKVDYQSLPTAEKVANRMAQKTGAVFDAYQCGECSGFHIGKRP